MKPPNSVNRRLGADEILHPSINGQGDDGMAGSEAPSDALGHGHVTSGRCAGKNALVLRKEKNCHLATFRLAFMPVYSASYRMETTV